MKFISERLLDFSYKEIFIERILPDNKFWISNLPKLDNFFEVCILPEIIGKYYTNLSLASEQKVPQDFHSNQSENQNTNLPNSKELWYTCRGDETKDMVGCDNENCKWKWLHFDFVGLKRAPKSEVWYCPVIEICQNSEKAKKENKSDSLFSLVKMVLRTLLQN